MPLVRLSAAVRMGSFVFNMDYTTQLRHPKWQKKRLEILNRDSFTCKVCLDTETNLQIHHKEYISGRKAWEYDDDNFTTLCEHCHKNIEAFKTIPLIPLIASKIYRPHDDHFDVTTIVVHEDKRKFVSIDRFSKIGNIRSHVTLISEGDVSDIDNLFLQADKLIK